MRAASGSWSQRYTLNPLFRLLLAIGVNPFGLAILETRGRVSGKIRRVPVGNGRKGDSFWIIAEHGSRVVTTFTLALADKQLWTDRPLP